MPIYMKIEGVKGRVIYGGEGGWFELESANLGGSQSPAVGRSGGGTSTSVFHLTRAQDPSSSELLKESLNGKGRKVTIVFCKTDKASCVPHMKIELENVLISSYSVSGHGGDRPMESLSINFTKITYKTGSQAQLQNEGTLQGATR